MKKELKQQHPDLAQSALDILARLDPSKTNKYLPFMVRRVRKTNEQLQDNVDRENATGSYSIPVTSYLDLAMVHMFTEGGFFPNEDHQTLKLFHELSENNRIAQKDINQYKDFDQLRAAISEALMAQEERARDKAIQVLLDNEDYFILRPLSYEASVKYGYNTKWCTAAAHRDSHFYDYTRYGMLIYFYNKKTKEKMAMHARIEMAQLSEITFWDAADRRIDTYESSFDSVTIQTLVRELKKNPLSNYDLSQEHGGKAERQEMNKAAIENIAHDGDMYPAPENPINPINGQAMDWSAEGFSREVEKVKRNRRTTLWNALKTWLYRKKNIYVLNGSYLDNYQRNQIIHNFQQSKLGKTHHLVLLPNFERFSFDTIEEA